MLSNKFSPDERNEITAYGLVEYDYDVENSCIQNKGSLSADYEVICKEEKKIDLFLELLPVAAQGSEILAFHTCAFPL